MIDEGVVKYSLKYNQTDDIAIKECKKIENVRARLFSLGLIGAYSNGIGFGNISVRYKKKNSFVITSTQTGELPKLTPSYYSFVKKVDFKKFRTYAMGPSRPSSEAITHACIYNLDPDIKAVIHIHNEKIWDYMLKNNYLSTNDTPYGTPEMVEDVKNIYKNIDPFLNNAFVMKGHFEGIVTFGKSLKDAEKTLYEIIKKLLK
ncbi:class II aldolase/adducin family protein [Arcobacter sp. LA11]|uniref:class II aldolase/adducin family protein n=1 Tax=Arcobacter sp. LA11 TaxID=1898176 RepID=UPI0009335AC5|nr:class II aldolase/adducin family protein [Arcobacter sp. LA11]